MMRATTVARTIIAALAMTSLTVFGQRVANDDLTSINARLGGLRKMEDAPRAVVTKQLALDIRQLPAGQEKLNLASSLTNLSTEGDFGEDTLQEVATTLSQALRETPSPSKGLEPAYPYTQLAQLERFEHVKVDLKDPEYGKAMTKIKEIEKARAGVDFTLTDLTGQKWTLSQLKGNVVLVNFWATWCPPCRAEMPDMEQLGKEFKDKGLVILAISDEDTAKVQPFITEHKYTYPILLDPGRKVNEAYRVDGIPKSFVYNRNGKLVAQAIDRRTRGQFLKMLSAAGLKI